MEEERFSISIREITFRKQELNWLFAKYKHLENNRLYGILVSIPAPSPRAPTVGLLSVSNIYGGPEVHT